MQMVSNQMLQCERSLKDQIPRSKSSKVVRAISTVSQAEFCPGPGVNIVLFLTFLVITLIVHTSKILSATLYTFGKC